MTRKIAVGDLETDPFVYKQEIAPFAAQFYDGEIKRQFWGNDCVEQFLEFVAELPDEYLIYFHNGGKFDFFLGFLPYFTGNVKIINRRVVKAYIGKDEYRDSFAIMPESLSTFQGKYAKKEISYEKMKRDLLHEISTRKKRPTREIYKEEILEYLDYDCLTLYENVMAFRELFGDKLTIGSAAMKELRQRHKIDTCDLLPEMDRKEWDTKYRQFYYGGRTQCFKSGVIHGDYKIYDVNGMYQHVMRTYLHPVGLSYHETNELTEDTDFAIVRARNYGCLPVRTKNGVDFDVPEGIFFATIHEIHAGIETETLEIEEVIKAYSCSKKTKFDKFIDHFTEKKLDAERRGDKMQRANFKRVQNASYGKFATNADKFVDSCITYNELLLAPWKMAFQVGLWRIWEQPAKRKSWYNVATAASITGAARALLLRGLAVAEDPVYCDTDSIICREFHGLIHETELGAWKREGKKDPKTGKTRYDADSIAIAGKKLYAVFDDQYCIKQASKGARLTAKQILGIAEGNRVTFENPVPHFKFDGKQEFIARRIQKTAKPGYIRLPGIQQSP